MTQTYSPLLPIETRGLSLTIAGTPLISKVDLHLTDPGITVIMGPNGAGKTMLLRLLHGLVEPTTGEFRMAGQPLSTDATRRQALVFQKPVLLRRSVAANIDFVLKARNSTADRDALLARVGLTAKARQPARLLSGGGQQRLALARALATEPDLLLLDEATASLDPASVQMIETIVREINAQGTKVLLVSHDLGQARRLADEVLFMSNGRLLEHATAQDFFTAPRTEAARAFLDGRLHF